MKFEVEITRHNVTPAQFLAYVRHTVDKKGGEDLRSDLNLDYFKRGDDLNFDTDDGCTREKSVSRPYEMQTFIRHENGSSYNEICEFTFDDNGKTGTGYYYLMNEMNEEATTEEEQPAQEEQDWNAASEAVHAAVLPFAEAIGRANIEAAQEEQPAPDYLRENWPTSNKQPGIYYSIEFTSPGSACVAYHPCETVDDMQTYLAQLQREGHRIRAAWRHDRTTGERRQFIPETRQEQTDRENRETCRRIAEELEVYASGDAYKCPHCGEVHTMGEYEETEHENDDGYTCYTCPYCGEEIEEDDLEAVSLYDFFEDCLDIEYRVSGRARDALRSVQVMVTCGGPNIYIDTASKAVELYWWGDRASYPLLSDTVAAVDEWAEEYWSCL